MAATKIIRKEQWHDYIEYVKRWARYHASIIHAGSSPDTFDVWLSNIIVDDDCDDEE